VTVLGSGVTRAVPVDVSEIPRLSALDLQPAPGAHRKAGRNEWSEHPAPRLMRRTVAAGGRA